MSSHDIVEELADLFRQTGKAHHQAFIETDGDDPEWPLWYAAYLQARLNDLLDTELTQSEIVHGLIEAEQEREEEDEEDWAFFYADYFQDMYA